MEKVQGGNARLLSNLIEYYCNNCNRYFDAESQGFGYPTCPYCGSDNVSDF